MEMSLEEISLGFLQGHLRISELKSHLSNECCGSCSGKKDVPTTISFIRKLLEHFHVKSSQMEGSEVIVDLILMWLARLSNNEISVRLFEGTGSSKFVPTVIKVMMFFLFKTSCSNHKLNNMDRLHSLISILHDSVMIFELLKSDVTYMGCETKYLVLSQVGLLISQISKEMKIMHLKNSVSPELYSSVWRSIESFLSQRWLGQFTLQNERTMRLHVSYVIEQSFLFVLSCPHYRIVDFRIVCKYILDRFELIPCNLRFDKVLEMVIKCL